MREAGSRMSRSGCGCCCKLRWMAPPSSRNVPTLTTWFDRDADEIGDPLHMGATMKKLLALGTVVLGILTAGATPAAAQTVLPRSGWVATASTTNSGEPASRAIDGSSSTRWSTGSDQTAGQWFSIDMITAQSFSQLTIDPTGSANDWTRGY